MTPRPARSPARPLPPGQQLAATGKWPIVGERQPATQAPRSAEQWSVEVRGLVNAPRSWTIAELERWPQVLASIDVHCVTRWSQPGMEFGGVWLADLLSLVEPLPGARFVSFVAWSERQHSTSLPLEWCREAGVLLALMVNGLPLTSEHGGPIRVVTPGRYFYKSLKWLRHVELLAEDRLGYWEAEAGYHNEADPWREQRYVAPAITRQEAERVLATRDFRGLDLRGLAAARRSLSGLQATAALLRDADFREAELTGACFEQANLSNAHFEAADLRGASFRQADVEGANFERADLRAADFRGASVFGATFVSPAGDAPGAQLDASTRFDPAALDQLTPEQAEYLQASGWHR